MYLLLFYSLYISEARGTLDKSTQQWAECPLLAICLVQFCGC